jgi:hypothetical protein
MLLSKNQLFGSSAGSDLQAIKVLRQIMKHYFIIKVGRLWYQGAAGTNRNG